MFKKILFVVALCLISFSDFAQQTKDTLISLHYNTNEYALNNEQQLVLGFIKSQYISIKKIEAFADTVGSKDYNKNLTIQRAKAVKGFCVKNDIACSNDIFSFGEDHPQLAKMDENRRVDLYCSIKIEVKDIVVERKIKDTLVLNLKDINFVPNSPEIEYESVYKLPAIVKQLKEMKPIKIEITGHCNLGSKRVLEKNDFFFKLSQARALTIFEYLKDNGIAAETMNYKGVGNSDPLFPNPKNEDEARQNMRVVIKLYY